MAGKKKNTKRKTKTQDVTVSDKSAKKKERKQKSKEAPLTLTGSKEMILTMGHWNEKEIESQDYYQGLVAKEDLEGILESPGDFVIRMDCKPGELSKYVLCVLAPKKEYNDLDSTKIIKEFVVQREGKNIFIIGGQLYPGIVQLIEDLLNKKISLPNEDAAVGEIVLRRGMSRPSWELKHEWFGKVFKGEFMQKEGRAVPVAIKVATNDEDHKTLADTLKEARAMRNIEHPNIIKFYGIVIERDPVMLVIELVNRGSLLSHIKKNPSSEPQKHKFALQAAWGLEYLHQKKVIHRDIAARNCLLNKAKEDDDELTLKIADFGLSRVGEFYQIHGRRTLPIRYLPFESFNAGMFTPMSDCWMYGALLFEIYSDGQELYEGNKLPKVKERIGRHELQEIPDSWPKEAKTLIDKCWQKEPKDRITMKAAAEMLEKVTKQKTPVVCHPEMMRKKGGKTKKKGMTTQEMTCVTETSEKSAKTRKRAK